MPGKEIFAVVMAGGKGERFWPRSRVSKPKQLLRLLGDLTLIEQTVERLEPLAGLKNTLIITNADYVAPMRSLLPDIPEENIIGEPMGRDTAPCVALAAALVAARTDNPDATMVVVPADHAIKDSATMVATLDACADMAMAGHIVTIGIPPSFPSTGYGYIKCGEKLPADSDVKFYESEGFREKPDEETAEKFLADGSYKWNSGMFVWTVEAIMDALRKHAPSLAEGAEALKNAAKRGALDEELEPRYSSFEKISVDYAVMEKVDNVAVAECPFDWDDVGSWSALRNQITSSENNNVVQGLHIGLDTKDCVIVGDSNHLISTIDVEDLIIVHTDDATLVCKSQAAQRVKEIVHAIAENENLRDYL